MAVVVAGIEAVAVESLRQLLGRSESGERRVSGAVHLWVDADGLCLGLAVVRGRGLGLCLWGQSLGGGTLVESLCRRCVEVAAVRCGATAVVDVRSRADAGCARRGRVVSVRMQL